MAEEDSRAAVRRGLGDLAELSAATSAAVAWPVLDSFGRSPETFIAHGAGPAQVVAFAVVVFGGPPLLLLAFELAVAALAGLRGGQDRGRSVRRQVHELLVVAGFAVAVARWGRDGTRLPATTLVGLALGAAVAVALARARVDWVRRFVRLLGVTSVGYVLLFLTASPASELLAGAQVDAAVRAEFGAQPPPVVVVVFDALPTSTLLDGRGHIDRALFPHFARLADDATWYRNNTTVSGWTLESLPVLLTGTFPASPARARLGDVHQRNLFTLLGGSHRLYVEEPVTDLCPPRSCAPGARATRSSGATVAALVSDAARMWWRGARNVERPVLSGALDDGRYDRAAEWIDNLPLEPDSAGGQPLVFLHVVVPHDPFDYLPDGRRYEGTDPVAGTDDDVWVDDGDRTVAQLRYLLQVQAADALLGRLLDRLDDAGVYDDALVAVTADHGISFDLDQPSRDVTADQYEQILWTPLLVKRPAQTSARVDDADVESIDLLPLLAAELGVELPWDVDGRSPRAGEATGRDRRRARPGEKELIDWSGNRLDARIDDEALLTVDATEGFRRVLDADPVAARGPLALWRAAPYGELVGRPAGDPNEADAPSDADEGSDDGNGEGGDGGSDEGGDGGDEGGEGGGDGGGGEGGEGGGDDGGDGGGDLGGVGDVPEVDLTIDGAGRFDDVDLDDPLPLEMTGTVDGSSGRGRAGLAIAVNGTVAGTAAIPGGEGSQRWRVLLWPDAFVDGENQVEVYLVTGSPEDPTFRRIPRRSR